MATGCVCVNFYLPCVLWFTYIHLHNKIRFLTLIYIYFKYFLTASRFHHHYTNLRLLLVVCILRILYIMRCIVNTNNYKHTNLHLTISIKVCFAWATQILLSSNVTAQVFLGFWCTCSAFPITLYLHTNITKPTRRKADNEPETGTKIKCN